jgi:molybdopterin converting factor small subunit
VTRVVVHLAAPIQALADRRDRVTLDVPGGTVGAALDRLGARWPALRDRVLTEQGELRPHVNVFVGDESIRFTGGLGTLVPHGAEIWILPAVSGG